LHVRFDSITRADTARDANLHVCTRAKAADVISWNLKRRHLTESQRSMVSAKLANMPLGGAVYRSANLPTDIKPISQTQAAELLNVSTRLVADAVRLETLMGFLGENPNLDGHGQSPGGWLRPRSIALALVFGTRILTPPRYPLH
jgi:hypothetical protein